MIIRITFFLIKKLLYLAWYCLVFILACFLDSDLLITSVFADSGDEDDSSPTENIPKRDKGKGRAVYTESLEVQDVFDKELMEEIWSKEQISKEEQEKFDFEFAKRLQDQEYQNSSLPYNQSDEVKSESDWTVLSSEIHSDDSDITKNKKLKVKEYENNNRLNTNLEEYEGNNTLKRSYIEDSDNENNRPNQKKQKKK